MRKVLNRMFTQLPDWMKNILFVLATILVIVSMFAFSTFMFWLKIQAASFMFG